MPKPKRSYISKRKRGPRITLSDLVGDGLLVFGDIIFWKKQPEKQACITRRLDGGHMFARYQGAEFERPHFLGRAFGEKSAHTWQNLVCKRSGKTLFYLREMYKSRHALPLSRPHNASQTAIAQAAKAPQAPDAPEPRAPGAIETPNVAPAAAPAAPPAAPPPVPLTTPSNAPTSGPFGLDSLAAAFAVYNTLRTLFNHHDAHGITSHSAATALLQDLCTAFHLPRVLLIASMQDSMYAASTNTVDPSIIFLPREGLSLERLLDGFLAHAQNSGAAQDALDLLVKAYAHSLPPQ